MKPPSTSEERSTALSLSSRHAFLVNPRLVGAGSKERKDVDPRAIRDDRLLYARLNVGDSDLHARNYCAARVCYSSCDLSRLRVRARDASDQQTRDHHEAGQYLNQASHLDSPICPC